ncbi:hypothetical protein [Natronorubrum sulfidifaciens]|uniref:Uncharacterized protein n=1 Tax=Natronorubrum sulfidifaciens JCM 14089 TaxID=1230460 RepID=L9WB49_9EURY|nr:hypothetical protein [Natronorubrum sulfidifaciens]ELY46587.1 hypothetical protein C495_05753 [Natronorubrum sulfidifaciens JCM 14089]
MLESVPVSVEAAIYLYFVAVAAIGCYLHGRLWLGHRGRNRTSDSKRATTQTDEGT